MVSDGNRVFGIGNKRQHAPSTTLTSTLPSLPQNMKYKLLPTLAIFTVESGHTASDPIDLTSQSLVHAVLSVLKCPHVVVVAQTLGHFLSKLKWKSSFIVFNPVRNSCFIVGVGAGQPHLNSYHEAELELQSVSSSSVGSGCPTEQRQFDSPQPLVCWLPGCKLAVCCLIIQKGLVALCVF